MRFVAVTSCPTGIAHSEMAAEALEVAAGQKGHEIHVEVQGASGAPPLDSSVIAGADAVIFAVDAMVRDRDRFAGLPSVEVRTREAIDKAPEILDRAAAAAKATPTRVAAAVAGGPGGPGDTAQTGLELGGTGGAGRAETVRRWLMTGVSYMIPFVVAGGILIALAFVIGELAVGKNGPIAVTKVPVLQDGKIQFPSDVHTGFWLWLGAVLLSIGGFAFSMLVPILAGFVVIQLKKLPIKGTLRRMMPILVYPVGGGLIVGLIMLLVVGQPVASANHHLQNWMNGLSGTNEILLGILIGAMMAFDMGGPVNKVAYAFGLAALDAGNYQIMAAVMAAGMTPPLGMALATVLRPGLYNEAEKRAGQAAWLLGASFITEGAIPFAAADPLRVIPSLMAGSALTGVLSFLFNATLRAPHGGIWVVLLIGHWPLYLLAIAAGTVLTAVVVNALKATRRVGEPVPAGVTVGA